MNVWAGSWLICSVCIERTMQMSSAIDADVREQRRDLLPRLAAALERVLRAEAAELLPLQLRDRLALGERLGHRLAVHLGELRLVVEGLEVRRPAGHERWMTRLARGGKCRRGSRHAIAVRRRRSSLRRRSAARGDGLSSEASAATPQARPPDRAPGRRAGVKRSCIARMSSVRISIASGLPVMRPTDA